MTLASHAVINLCLVLLFWRKGTPVWYALGSLCVGGVLALGLDRRRRKAFIAARAPKWQ